MVRSIDHLDPDVDQRVSGQHTTGDGLANAGLHGVVIFLRDDTADNLVLDLDTLASLVRCDVDDRVAVLTTTAGLADELAFALCRGSDGFAVGNLRSTHGGLHLELAQHAVADDVQMQLTHAGNDQLAGLFVGEHPEGRVFLGKSLQRLGHLFAVAAGVWLHGHRDHRLREGRRLEHHVQFLVAKCVTGGDVLEPHDRGDVTGVDRVHIGSLVGLQHDQAADAITLAGTGIVNGVALVDLA